MPDRDQSKYHAERQSELRDAGRCVWCAGRTRRGHALCHQCHAEQRDRYERQRSGGICTKCGRAGTGGMYACAECRERSAAARRLRRGSK